MIKELIKIANSLDAKGFTKEADALDEIIRSAQNTNQIESTLSRKEDSKGRANITSKTKDESTGAFRDEEDASFIDLNGKEYVLSYEKYNGVEQVSLGEDPKINGGWSSGFSKVKTKSHGLKYYDLTKRPPAETVADQFTKYKNNLKQRLKGTATEAQDVAKIDRLTDFA